jgi:YaiO family outer membrane protein
MTGNRPNRYRLAELLVLLSLAFTSIARAQDTRASAEPVPTAPADPVTAAHPAAETKILTNYAETGGNYMSLSDSFGTWSGGYFRSVLAKGNSVWNMEMNGQREFGDAGVYFAAGDTYTFTPDWYGALTVGSSVGGFFWPRFRTDGFINKKWLARKQWITTFGLSYYAAKDVHRDHSFFVGTTYYFDKPWVVEEGVRFNVSNPGNAFSPAGFVAVTQGRDKHHYITVRAGFGEEAYQLIGPTTELADFQSQDFSLTVRKWVGRSWGFNFVADYYHSPFYVRGGSTLGFFKDF